MGGFLRSFAPYAAVLQGQQQGQNASAFERAKLAMEQRKAAASTKQIVQMPDGTFKIVDLADPNAGATLGTAVDYGPRIQALLKSNPPDYLKGLLQTAATSNDPQFQASVYQGALTAMEKPSKSTTSGKFLPPVYARAMTDNSLTDESQVTAPMLSKAYQAIQKENSGLIAGRTPPQIVMVPGYDAMGRPTASVERVPKREGEATPVMTAGSSTGGPAAPLVGKKISGTESKTVAYVNSIIPQLAGLRAKMVAIGPEKWNRNAIQRGLDYEKAKHGDVLPSDPDLAKLTSQLIQVETNAKSALGAASGTRAYQFLRDASGHIPTAYGDYNSILTNIDTLSAEDGPYQSLLKSYELGGPSGGSASAAGGGNSTSAPTGLSPLDGGYFYNPADGSIKQFRVTP